MSEALGHAIRMAKVDLETNIRSLLVDFETDNEIFVTEVKIKCVNQERRETSGVMSAPRYIVDVEVAL